MFETNNEILGIYLCETTGQEDEVGKQPAA